MFYKNLKKHKSTTEKKLVFSIFDAGIEKNKDDSISSGNECKIFYNLSYEDGALKTGLGFRDFRVPASTSDLSDLHVLDFSKKIDEIKDIWVERWFNTTYEEFIYQILVMDSNFNIYGALLIDEYNGVVAVRTDKLSSAPTLHSLYRLKDEDVSLFFSKEGLGVIGQKQNVLYEDVPAMISCAVHYDNFFGIANDSRNTLVYTTNLDITSWDNEAKKTLEFLDNRGAFLKLVAFNDYVYLFREHGITKLSIYTSKNDFSVAHLYTSTSKIFEKSICVCGEEVFFMTRDGLYAFNGSSVKKICEQYEHIFQNLDNRNCSSACLDGKYYLATKCNFDDSGIVGCENGDFVNNVLFEIDVESQKLNILRGINIKKILAIDTPYISKLVACFYDKPQKIGELCFCGKYFDDAIVKEWKSYSSDLGEHGKRKRLKELILASSTECEVEIISDEETKTFKFEGSEKEQRLPINIYGKNFQFCFKSSAESCEICKPRVVFEVVS